MFKLLISFIAMLGIAGAACAEQVDLQAPWNGSGASRQYHEVPNTSGIPVTIGLPQLGSGSVQLWFDDQYDVPVNHFKSYWIGQYAGNGLLSQVQKCVFAVDQNGGYASTCDLNGEVAQVTLSDTSRRVCGGSGRGGTCHTLWTLISGTILR